jgi:hypothetical protein
VRLFPYVPVLDASKYWHAVKPLLFDPQFRAANLYRHFTIWLAIAVLMEGLAESAWARWLTGFVLAAELCGRILITGLTLSPDEVAGSAIAVLIWLAVGWRLRARVWIVTALFVGMVVEQAMEPFEFQTPAHAFGWVPFRSFFYGSFVFNVLVFLEKSFIYGSLVWLLERSGLPLKWAAISGAGLVLVLRLTQVFLPGRSAEITDAVLLVLMAGLMKWLPAPAAENRSGR